MRTFVYGKKTITYSLRRSARKTLAITVCPNLEVQVTAPQNAEEAAIEQIQQENLPAKRRSCQISMATPPLGPRTTEDLSSRRHSSSGMYIPETIQASRATLALASQSFRRNGLPERR